jgi:hypothetical protein
VNLLSWKASDPLLKILRTAELLLTVVLRCLLFPISAFAWGKAGFLESILKFIKKLNILRFSAHKTLDVCSNIVLKSCY